MRQVNHRRTLQAAMEKKLKNRQAQETYALKAREKYEGDKARINSYTQQLAYMTGVDAQRVEQKLARTRETAKANEKDFLGFTQTLMELLAEWQTEWKIFCDSCHDLEEDRLEFMKDNLWLYANEVSTLCVSDDQVRLCSSASIAACRLMYFFHSLVRGYERPLINSSLNATCSVSQRNMVQVTTCRNPRPFPLIRMILRPRPNLNTLISIARATALLECILMITGWDTKGPKLAHQKLLLNRMVLLGLRTLTRRRLLLLFRGLILSLTLHLRHIRHRHHQQRHCHRVDQQHRHILHQGHLHWHLLYLPALRHLRPLIRNHLEERLR